MTGFRKNVGQVRYSALIIASIFLLRSFDVVAAGTDQKISVNIIEESLLQSAATIDDSRAKGIPSLIAQLTNEARSLGLRAEEIRAIIARADVVLRQRDQSLTQSGLMLWMDPVAEARERLLTLSRDPQIKDSKIAAAALKLSASLTRPIFTQNLSFSNPYGSGEDSPKAAWTLVQQAALQKVLEAVSTHDSQVVPAFNETIAPYLRAASAANLKEILESVPEIADQRATKVAQKLIATAQNGQILITDEIKAELVLQLKDTMSSVGESITGSIQQWKSTDLPDTAQNLILDTLKDKTGIDARKAKAAAEALQKGDSLSRTQAGLYLASTILQQVDPALANDVQKVGGLAIQFAQLVNTASSSSTLAGMGIETGASSVVSGGGGVAVMLAMQAMEQENQKRHAEVMAALAQISQQVQQVRVEMHGRFDRIDHKLAHMYTTMSAQFDRLGDMVSSVDQRLLLVSTGVASIQRQLYFDQDRVDAAIRDLLTAMGSYASGACVDWKSLSVSIEMRDYTYVECIKQLQLRAIQDSKLSITLGGTTPPSITETEKWNLILQRPPESQIATLFNLANQLGYPLIDSNLSSMIVEPSLWSAAAEGYRRLAHDWPNYYATIPVSITRGILNHGVITRGALQNLATGSSGQSLFAELASRYREAAKIASKEVRTNAYSAIWDESFWPNNSAPWPRYYESGCPWLNTSPDCQFPLPASAQKLAALAWRAQTVLGATEELYSYVSRKTSPNEPIPFDFLELIDTSPHTSPETTGLIDLHLLWKLSFPDGQTLKLADVVVTSHGNHKYPSITCGGIAGCVPNPEQVRRDLTGEILPDGVSVALDQYFLDTPQGENSKSSLPYVATQEISDRLLKNPVT
ncbi:MAG: hypothetical protein MN733_23030, partial [Nitrososphaera sp.]|nr:hypothetical protein [Nitrososphaera sp.]